MLSGGLDTKSTSNEHSPSYNYLILLENNTNQSRTPDKEEDPFLSVENLKRALFGVTALISGSFASNHAFKYINISRSLTHNEFRNLILLKVPASWFAGTLLKSKLIALGGSFVFGYCIGTLGNDLFTDLNNGKTLGEQIYDWSHN